MSERFDFTKSGYRSDPEIARLTEGYTDEQFNDALDAAVSGVQAGCGSLADCLANVVQETPLTPQMDIKLLTEKDILEQWETTKDQYMAWEWYDAPYSNAPYCIAATDNGIFVFPKLSDAEKWCDDNRHSKHYCWCPTLIGDQRDWLTDPKAWEDERQRERDEWELEERRESELSSWLTAKGQVEGKERTDSQELIPNADLLRELEGM